MEQITPTLYTNAEQVGKVDALIKSGIIKVHGEIKTAVLGSLPNGRILFKSANTKTYVGLSNYQKNPEVLEDGEIVININHDVLEFVNYGIDNLSSLSVNTGVNKKFIKTALGLYKKYLAIAEENKITLSQESKAELMQDVMTGVINEYLTKREVKRLARERINTIISGFYYRNVYYSKKELLDQSLRLVMSAGLCFGLFFIARRLL